MDPKITSEDGEQAINGPNIGILELLQCRGFAILSLSQNRSIVRTIYAYVKPHGHSINGVLESD